ncbi:sulfite exporter TauE/SafE family protein [Histidinibacterium aquaticum]|uniref:Probable membrane transporter protein n=1 Tax=Histidinibacterium aquaticum TaxID=2613962 RepID=A0A5J5GJZ5_9RHOB|nr:sulfite exporter TauE/SafE family protein [Histidinibacterium aquaticum]KAA9007852.1 sulfite exporter TauE/SafE family protein [Histidinibacterium aquaticum]
MFEEGLVMAMIAFALGGILKGAIGAGTPVIAIPILALYHDVRFAVAVFALPALLSNIVQGWQYRAHILPRRFMVPLVLATMLGAFVGTVMLATLPEGLLTGTVAVLTIVYVVFRLMRPDWSLGLERGQKIVVPVGLAAGVLQGAAGISAPVSLTFLNALRIPREVFIGTVSVFFIAMASVQLPTLIGLGILTGPRLAVALVACIPLFAGMPVGDWIGRKVGKTTFDRIIMGLLVIIALRLLWGVVAG